VNVQPIKHKMRTRTGYKIEVSVVSPTLFQELRAQFRIDRKPFMHKYVSPETKAELEFVYEPPKEVPDKEKDLKAWELYKEYQAWMVQYNQDKAQYTLRRNRMVLVSAVKVLKKTGRGSWEYELENGDWRKTVLAGGIVIDEASEMFLFLKSEVLSNEQDYLKALDLATAEEVNMGDVVNAFDYFWTILARCPFIGSDSKSAERREQLLHEVLGGSNGSEDGAVT